MSSRTKRALIVIGVLLMPSFLYVVLSTGKHNVDKMEFFGPKTEGSDYTIGWVNVVTHLGDTISTSEWDDNIVVYNFFCLACSDSSARNALVVKAVTERFFDKKDIRYVSINLVPSEWDSMQLAEYIKPFNIPAEQWFFVNGKEDELKEFAKSLLIGTEYDPIGKEYGPGMATIVIVDKKQHIRGMLDGNQYVDKSTIEDVIKHLRLEEYQQNSKRREDQFERKRDQ